MLILQGALKSSDFKCSELSWSLFLVYVVESGPNKYFMLI